MRTRKTFDRGRRGAAMLYAIAVVTLLSILMLSIAQSAFRTQSATRSVRLRHEAELAGDAVRRLGVDRLELVGGGEAVRVRDASGDRVELRDRDGRVLAAKRLAPSDPTSPADANSEEAEEDK